MGASGSERLRRGALRLGVTVAAQSFLTSRIPCISPYFLRRALFAPKRSEDQPPGSYRNGAGRTAAEYRNK
jgi:hypothetical protein